MRIFKANAFEDRHGKSWICFDISRLNHSCVPNAELDGSVNDGSEGMGDNLQAIRDIAAGDEIFINYHSVLDGWTRFWRQKMLRKQYSFDCACACCSMQGPEASMSDARRQIINHLSAKLEGKAPQTEGNMDYLTAPTGVRPRFVIQEAEEAVDAAAVHGIPRFAHESARSGGDGRKECGGWVCQGC